MTSEPSRCLAEVAAVGSGAGFPIVEQGRSDGAFPFLKVSDMNLPGNARTIESWNNTVTEEVRARLRATAFPAGSVIFPKIGAAIGTNKKRLLTRPCCVDNNVMAVVPDVDHLEPHYLYYLLLTKNLSDFASDSNPPSIRKTVVETWQIPVPSLDEQRRIVDLLSRAEGIVRLRREAQKKAAEIIPALFLDMFGDPATNSKGWEVAKLEDVALFQEGPGIMAKDFRESGIPLVRLAGLSNGRVSLNGCNYVDPGTVDKKWSHFRLSDGDILVLTSATFGNPAVVDSEAVGAIFYTGIIRFRPKTDALVPGFLQSFLGSPWFLRQAQSLASGAVIKHFGPTHLKQMTIPVPPLKVQHWFANRLPLVSSIHSQQASALAKAEATFNALLGRAFSEGRENALRSHAGVSA